MWLQKHSLCLLTLLLFSPALALKKSYVVYLGSHSHGSRVSAADLHRVAHSHTTFLASFLGSHERAKDAISQSYQRHINGFAAMLHEEEAAQISKHPDVLSVFLNKGRKLHTTRSWDFLQLRKNGVVPSSSLWKKAHFGEDIIIGNLDSGVWPESRSFSDEGYGPPPAKWKGKCPDETKEGVPCNRKLIGARYFNQGYLTAYGVAPNASHGTARDVSGHGSHTLSTAAGNFVSEANVLGLGNGTASGGCPRARAAAYKVCWPAVDGHGGGCLDSDMLAAFDAAIEDGVDVLTVSIGGDAAGDYVKEAIAIGAFHAVKAGITVVCSAGNSGPAPGSVLNVAPWIITVGASTMDREIRASVELGNGRRFKGTGISRTQLKHKMYKLIGGAEAKAPNASASDALFCKKGSLDPKAVKGKIVVCLRGDEEGRKEKGKHAAAAGAAAMILCNNEANGNSIITDVHALPASHISYKDGLALLSYLNSTRDPRGYIGAATSEVYTKPSPFMAAFSSRGPNTVTPDILKPDITAPGVNVIAAFSEATEHTPFVTDSGTSMSCPHIAGIVGLLKKLHPHWSPAAIRSAMMTTARVTDNKNRPILDGSFKKATPFEYGSGHVRPNRAADPGLVYDLTTSDYLDFLCAIGYNETMLKTFAEEPYTCRAGANLLDFNYPSITVSNLTGSVTVTRKVKNVGKAATYVARVRAPRGVDVSVEPTQLEFHKSGEEKMFQMTLRPKSTSRLPRGYVFGRFAWTDGYHYVWSPITVQHAARS